MLPHPDTVCVLAARERRHVLAVAARERQAGGAVVVEGRRVTPPGRIAGMRGALLGLARRPGSVRPAAPDTATAPALP
jgi:hypothetical protein